MKIGENWHQALKREIDLAIAGYFLFFGIGSTFLIRIETL
jgi:hypothetical protein